MRRQMRVFEHFVSSDLWEAGVFAVFDHADKIGGSGCNKLGSKRSHYWVQKQGTVKKKQQNKNKTVKVERFSRSARFEYTHQCHDYQLWAFNDAFKFFFQAEMIKQITAMI